MDEEKNTITLHPVHGANGHLGYCPGCEQPSGELMFLGIANTVFVCEQCGTKLLSEEMPKEECPTCGSTQYRVDHELGTGETIPGSLCKTCREKLEHEEKLLKEGGIYFRCLTCNQKGIITDKEVCDKVREKSGITEGPVGVEFEEDCPFCIQRKQDPESN